jgi:hypothetical protein
MSAGNPMPTGSWIAPDGCGSALGASGAGCQSRYARVAYWLLRSRSRSETIDSATSRWCGSSPAYSLSGVAWLPSVVA